MNEHNQNEFKKCNICGDDSDKIGLYYGVVTCQACKKFFWRSQGDASKSYTCTKENQCEITLVSRAKCKYCRYQKCLSIGMDIKTCSSKVAPNLVSQCTICELPANGIHFGVLSCEGCKGFFRRSQLNNKFQTYECDYMCTKNQNAVLSNVQMNYLFNCKYCRYQKCITSGMSYENSKTGRQSNLLKKQISVSRTVPVKNKNNDSENFEIPISSSAKRFKAADKMSTNQYGLEVIPKQVEHQVNEIESTRNASFCPYEMKNKNDMLETGFVSSMPFQTLPTQLITAHHYYQINDFAYQNKFYNTTAYDQTYFNYNQYQQNYYSTVEPNSDYYKFYSTRTN